MKKALQSVFGFSMGAVVSILLAYLGGVVLLLVQFGIPLGMTPRQATAGEYLALLIICGTAATIGGRVAARRSHAQYSRAVVLVLAATLAMFMLWGFSDPASSWPRWWGPTIAATFAAGACLGGAALHRRFPKSA
jgi:hypothetical protein